MHIARFDFEYRSPTHFAVQRDSFLSASRHNFCTLRIASRWSYQLFRKTRRLIGR